MQLQRIRRTWALTRARQWLGLGLGSGLEKWLYQGQGKARVMEREKIRLGETIARVGTWTMARVG